VSNDTQFRLIQPGCFDDQLTEILRQGARTLVAPSAEARVADFLAKHVDLKTGDAANTLCAMIILPEREVMIGIGPVAIRPHVRGREAAAGAPGRVRVTPRSCRPTCGARSKPRRCCRSST
jgi:putative transposase